ncbi:glycosyltransferase family 4 protein [Candidatus Thiosymbion oneisti]|uniref:glycosyltransferase family 4 protein n=1 Tax=Candidatus Thiosymbion oneisti TaxID=589554 RepID=UPI000A923092|nr:glycosyltransferase family 4 protein [Candidatus Thiosymbion oneisti]
MKILVTANIVPFMPGGADYHIEGLTAALRRHGHDVVCLRFPFRFSPPAAISTLMDFCADYDLREPNGVRIDKVISLQFPGYGVLHDDHVLWLMHQHRAAYELYDETRATPDERRLRDRIRVFDDRMIGRIRHRFANSVRIAERLRHFNGLDVEPLYHPPYNADRFFCKPAYGYIFFPSRLETLKRQDLLIEAARMTRSPVGFLIAGAGGHQSRYQHLIETYGLGHKVRLLGPISEKEKLVYYARCHAVFFGPHEEDYGYVTLEAMLSAKPVITCTDSGGPLELVEHERTGLIVDPEPTAVAAAIDRLYQDSALAVELGRAGRRRYRELEISWDRVVARLLGPTAGT